MILLTGATGNVGSHLLSDLCRGGHAVRALVRSAEKADNLRGYDCETAVGDFDDPGSLHRALAGVDRLFLLSPAGERMAEQEKAVVDAAAAAHGQVRVVKLAAAGYHEGRTALGDQHAAVVEHLRVRGLPHTVLAPSVFMQNTLAWAGTISESGQFSLPAGDGAVSLVDAHDVAAVAAHVLTSDGHDGASYTVTGPEALTYNQVAERFTNALGKPVRYQDVPPAAAREAMVAAGMSAWLADALVELTAVYRSGGAAGTTDEVQKAIGRPARSFEDFLRDHLAAFRAL